MKANKRFQNQSPEFWANVRAISESVGYTRRNAEDVCVPSVDEMKKAMADRGLVFSHIVSKTGKVTALGKLLNEYFEYRAIVLNEFVEPRLMDGERAEKEFEILRKRLKPTRSFTMNKQKGEKKRIAFLTGIVEMIVEAYSQKIGCELSPKRLTTITQNGKPLRTFSRWLDGAFPSAVNPVAVWEIKEYYHSTSFGSRVADGVYETLLDGMELMELRKSEAIHVLHYFIIDSHKTWWKGGRSYLCRIIDALNMGYIDEVLFGYEVVEQLPAIVQKWVELFKSQS